MLAETGWFPDSELRIGIRRLLEDRLRSLAAAGPAAKLDFIEQCQKRPVPLVPHLAEPRHAEVATAFFEAVLGPRLAFSCALWEDADTLAGAEERMLARIAERAGIEDGMAILDLGCGWGAFALWAAERFPRARIVAVTNSIAQSRFLQDRARSRGLYHVTATTADVGRYEAEGRFDRAVCVELLEHVGHHERLLARMARWLARGGKLFVSHFCHREWAYAAEDRGPGDWMARHFMSGGLMPSADWLLHFADDWVAEQRWTVGGSHYARTSEAWLARLDAARDPACALFAESHGRDAARWVQRWRIFFLACAELFAHRDGREWGVAHVLLSRI